MTEEGIKDAIAEDQELLEENLGDGQQDGENSENSESGGQQDNDKAREFGDRSKDAYDSVKRNSEYLKKSKPPVGSSAGGTATTGTAAAGTEAATVGTGTAAVGTGALTVETGVATAAGGTAAGVGFSPILIAILIILLIFFFVLIIILILFFLLNANPKITKEGPFISPAGSEITYTMLVSYNGLAEDLIVEDPIPLGTTYVSSNPQAEIVYRDLDGDGAANEPVARWSFNDIQNPALSLIIINGKRSFYRERISITLLPSANVSEIYNAATGYAVNPIGSETPDVQGAKTIQINPCANNATDPYCTFLNNENEIVNFNKINELITNSKKNFNLNTSDKMLKDKLVKNINGQSSTLKTTPNTQISYYHTPDVFLTEIKGQDIKLTKQEAVQWFKLKGFSDEGLCRLPLIFYIKSELYKSYYNNKTYFYPLADNC